jgi:hypothetical protein
MRRPNPSFLKNVCLALCIGMLLHDVCAAQCVNNLGTKNYDTTLTSNGFGLFNLPIPQMDPDSGQLVSVKISATVTSNYWFNLTNVNTNPATYDLNIGQEDQFTLPGVSPYLNITPMYVGTYDLSPGQSQSAGPFPFMTGHVSSDSITSNVAPFLGNGTVSLKYMSFQYTNLWAYNFASYSFSNAINSTTQLSVQYLYCKAGIVLATALTRWSAQLTAPLTVKLDWSAVDETAGRQYEVQRSTDGRNFATINTIPATANGSAADYTCTDLLSNGTSGKLYYRLQIHANASDKFTWSSVKEISIDAAGKSLRLFPNPAADHLDIATGTPNSDWQADIFSATGALVQRESFFQSNLLHLVFTDHLANGTYFLRLTDLRGQKVLASSFVVR